MTVIVSDYQRGCYVVALSYGNKQYLVDVRIELGRLRGERARSDSGSLVTGDLVRHLHSQAPLECGAWLMSELARKQSYRAISKAEVVEIAFIATALEWAKNPERTLPRLTAADLRLVQSMGRNSRAFMQNAYIDGYITRRPLRKGTFRALVDTAIRNEWKDAPFSTNHREFFESVLTKAMGWKNLTIPGDVYYHVQEYRTGLMLAFQLSERPDSTEEAI